MYPPFIHINSPLINHQSLAPRSPQGTPGSMWEAHLATWRSRGRWDDRAQCWEKTWEVEDSHGKIMGKSWENHGKIMGKSWENCGKEWKTHETWRILLDHHGNILYEIIDMDFEWETSSNFWDLPWGRLRCENFSVGFPFGKHDFFRNGGPIPRRRRAWFADHVRGWKESPQVLTSHVFPNSWRDRALCWIKTPIEAPLGELPGEKTPKKVTGEAFQQSYHVISNPACLFAESSPSQNRSSWSTKKGSENIWFMNMSGPGVFAGIPII